MPMVQVHAIFDCKHERVESVDVDADTEIPATVRGVGKCRGCIEEDTIFVVSGIAPKPGGKEVVLDSIQLMPL